MDFDVIYRFGGHWSSLDYVGGDEELVSLSGVRNVYDAVVDGAHDAVDVGTDFCKCKLHSLVHIGGRLFKKKLSSERDILNILESERLPVIFVTVNITNHTFSEPHLQWSNIFVNENHNLLKEGASSGSVQNRMNSQPPGSFISLPFDETYQPDLLTISLEDSISIGSIYYSKEALSIAIGLYHISKFGEYRTKKFDKERLKVVCKLSSCPFTIAARCNGVVWHVCNVTSHTCMLDIHRVGPRKLPAKVIGAYFAPRLVEEHSSLVSRNMITELQQRNSIHTTYDVALKVKHHAIGIIYGDQNETFSRLPSYLYLLKHLNPGTVTALEIDVQEHKFKNAFFALSASIFGFHTCSRPIFVIDGTHLKGEYNGILFVAVTHDDNSHVFPLGVGVGHLEDDKSWIWFLKQLRVTYGCPNDLVIVSDAHKSIANAVTVVFPEAHHCHCYHHLQNNMKLAGKSMASLFYEASYTHRIEDFERSMQSIQTWNPQIAEDLFRKGYHRWARSKCHVRRYEFMNSNSAESFNSRALWLRKLPLTPALEVVRSIIEKWFYKRRAATQNREELVTPNITSDMGEMILKSSSMDVQ